jgi:DNA primase
MDFAQHLKSSIDIVRVIGEYVRLQPSGPGRFRALCPFHQEKTPSFHVHQTRQFYKCFGCNAGGDVINFVMAHDGMSFWEAVQFLAERHGIPLPKRAEHSDADSKLRGALYEMHKLAAEVFRASLRGPQGAEARAYLNRRAVSQDLIDSFELGFAEASGQALMRRFSERSFTPEQLESSGLVRKRTEGSGYYDYFRGRLLFPIHNETGKVIGFGGRALKDEDQPKYLNSPETPIYRKTSVLYNLHRAREAMRRSGRAVLVEGYMDVIGVYAAGVTEAVASCGTALTNAQVRAIHRHADAVVVNFDPDTAGANAAERAIQLFLDEGVHVRVLSLAGGDSDTKLDPDEYVKRFGAEAYKAKLDQAAGYFHWLADRARAKFDMRGPEGRMEAFKFLLPSVQKVPDKLERAAVANDLASYLGVEPGLVLEQFRRSATERRAAARPAPRPAIPALERMLLAAMLASRRVRAELLPALRDESTEGFTTREIFENLRHVDALEPARVFGDLEARLSEAGRTLLHEAVAADDTDDEEVAWEQAEACLRRLDADHRKRRVADLRARVKSAEREGRVEEALSWMAELNRLERASLQE